MNFSLAEPADGPRLRALVRSEAMPGWVRLAQEREPDFFHAAETHGEYQVIVARSPEGIVGMGCRSWREVFVNGQPAPMGYLSGLRSAQSARKKLALARGYAYLKELHADGRVPGYLSTIVEANTVVRTLLTSSRADLPQYHDLGRFFTFALPLVNGAIWRAGRSDLSVAHAAEEDLDDIILFLDGEGRKRQFFPVVRRADLGRNQWRDLHSQDLMVARERNGRIAGVVACWDQSRFKQTRVVAYAPWLARSRWACNAVLALMGLPALPRPGEMLHHLNLALVCIRDDRADTFSTLLNAISRERAGKREQFACCGFHERDPLVEVFKSRSILRYVSRVYWVAWENETQAARRFDRNRIPHLEVGCL